MLHKPACHIFLLRPRKTAMKTRFMGCRMCRRMSLSDQGLYTGRRLWRATWPSQPPLPKSPVTAFSADSWDPCCRTVIGFVSIAGSWCRQKCWPRNSRSKRKATDRRRLWDAATPPDTLSLFTERGDITAVDAKRLPTPLFCPYTSPNESVDHKSLEVRGNLATV